MAPCICEICYLVLFLFSIENRYKKFRRVYFSVKSHFRKFRQFRCSDFCADSNTSLLVHTQKIQFSIQNSWTWWTLFKERDREIYWKSFFNLIQALGCLLTYQFSNYFQILRKSWNFLQMYRFKGHFITTISAGGKSS